MRGDDVLRETFETYAERAPRGVALARAARERAGARRRARLAVGAAAVATAVVAVGAVALVPSRRAAAPPVASPAGTPTPTRGLTGPVRYESWHGLQVAVPAAMLANQYRCTAPERDTILVPRGGGLNLCGADEPPGLTVAALGTAASFGRGRYELSDVDYEPATLDGRPAQRVTATSSRDGRHVVGILVFDLDVGYWVISPDRERAETLVAQAHLVDVDHAGCPTEPAQVYADAPPQRPGASETMVPGEPVELTACRYDEAGLLMASKRVAPGADLDGLVRELNALPPGRQEPAPDWSSDCTKHTIEPLVYTFRYAAGPPLDVIVHINGCDRLGASNGAIDAKFTPSFLEFVGRFVGTPSHWMGWYKEPKE